MPETATAIRVSAAERDVAVDEVRAVLASVRDDAYREQLETLVEALEAGDGINLSVRLNRQGARVHSVEA